MYYYLNFNLFYRRRKITKKIKPKRNLKERMVFNCIWGLGGQAGRYDAGGRDRYQKERDEERMISDSVQSTDKTEFKMVKRKLKMKRPKLKRIT